MDNITKLAGTRIRGFRKGKAFKPGRGWQRKQSYLPIRAAGTRRKEPTMKAVMKIANGLEIPFDQLFVNITSSGAKAVDYIPDRIMYLVAELSPKEQRIIYDLIIQALKLRN